MTAIGGSIVEIALDGRIFAVSADADANRKIGGYENEVAPNGDGSARLIKTRVSSAFNDLTIEIDDSRSDQEYLQSLQNKNDFFPVTATLASGFVWSGQMQITGEVSVSTQNATASISFMGNGTFDRQS